VFLFFFYCIIEPPDEPVLITKQTPNGITIECRANSTSIMPSNIPDHLRPIMKYNWMVDKKFADRSPRYKFEGENGNQLILTNIRMSDDRTLQRCVVQETGSKFKKRVSEMLRIRCKYVAG